jgi:hypothetical protein
MILGDVRQSQPRSLLSSKIGMDPVFFSDFPSQIRSILWLALWFTNGFCQPLKLRNIHFRRFGLGLDDFFFVNGVPAWTLSCIVALSGPIYSCNLVAPG